MGEIISKNECKKIKSEIEKSKYCIIKGKVEGLVVDLEEMKENLVTNVKKIIVPKKRMNLHTLLFSTNNIVDVDIFFKYIGEFSEGSMELYIYKTENESLDEKMYLCVKVIDEESILIERNIDG